GDALFVVAGAVDPDDIASRLDLAFAGWEGTATADQQAATPPGASGRDMVFVHKPGSVQAVIRMGHLFPDATGADWVTLDVANQVLGSPSAAFTAWMMSILREEKGYTYGAYSLMSERLGPGAFIMQGEFRNEVADSALTIMMDLAHRIRAGDIPAEDLQEAKSYLTGAFPLEIETPQEVAGQVASNRLLGRPDSYLQEYRSRVAAVETADIAEVASMHIDPENMVIVVVGDAAQVLERVRPFADRVTVVDTDGEPLDPQAVLAGAEATDLDYDASGLEARALSYGLLVDGNQVGEATTRWERQGDTFTSTAELPAGMAQTTTFQASTFTPASLVFRAGAMGEFSIQVQGGRATGEGLNLQTGQPQDVDQTLPEGAMLDGMPDVALALHDYEATPEFTLQIMDVSGAIQGTTISMEGTETVEVPAGTFETYRLEMQGQQPATAWVTIDAPHVVVQREAALPTGQSLRYVLLGDS
ncbi:MAG TPA: insulinase family protein, partial [Longimicrobiales bacterium]|nr:insulinase family protein [Longimicrobiales bacterium]